VNGEAGAGYAYSRYSDGYKVERQTWSASARLNVPIFEVLGGSLSATAGRELTDIDLSAVEVPFPPTKFSCDSNLWSAATTLFVRDPTLGRVRANYRMGRLPYVCGYSSSSGEVTDRATSSEYGLDAEYYLDDWTLAAAFFRQSVKDDVVDLFTGEESTQRSASNRYSLAAAYYPTSDWRVGASVVRLASPYDNTSYNAQIEYQPPSWENRVSGDLAYSRSGDTNTVGVRLTYYFGPQVNLKQRDRYLR
jgi:hypothetical protein